MQMNYVEKMARTGSKAHFLLSSGDRVSINIMDIGHDTNVNGTHKGMILFGKKIPTTVIEMQLVNIWKKMLQGKQLDEV